MNGAALRDAIGAAHGEALRIGRDVGRAVQFDFRRWRHTRYVGVYYECPHCGALVASKAARVRHHQREQLIEVLLQLTGLQDEFNARKPASH
jgi:hypothetical protein